MLALRPPTRSLFIHTQTHPHTSYSIKAAFVMRENAIGLAISPPTPQPNLTTHEQRIHNRFIHFQHVSTGWYVDVHTFSQGGGRLRTDSMLNFYTL